MPTLQQTKDARKKSEKDVADLAKSLPRLRELIENGTFDPHLKELASLVFDRRHVIAGEKIIKRKRPEVAKPDINPVPPAQDGTLETIFGIANKYSGMFGYEGKWYSKRVFGGHTFRTSVHAGIDSRWSGCLAEIVKVNDKRMQVKFIETPKGLRRGPTRSAVENGDIVSFPIAALHDYLR